MSQNIEKLANSVWKVRDQNREFETKWEDVIEQILEGKIDHSATIFDSTSNKWVPVTEKREFAPMFPILPFMNFGEKAKYMMKLFERGFTGIVTIGPHGPDLFSIAEAFRLQGLPKGITFFIPILNRTIAKRITRPIRLLPLFEGLLAGAFFEDQVIEASNNTPLFAIAANYSDGFIAHSMIPYKFPIPETEKGKLAFELAPKKWVCQCLWLDTSRSKSGANEIEFRTASTAQRAAKTAAAAVLTLGMLRYTPGYKGFSIKVDIVESGLPKPPGASLRKGEMLYEMKDYWGARAEVETALKDDPNNAKAHRLLGAICSLLDKNAEAEMEFKKAIELNRSDDVAHNNLGTLYDKMDRPQEAEKEFKEAVSIKPQDVVNRYNLALFLRNKDRLKEAWNECLELLKADPKFMPAYSGFYSILMKQTGKGGNDLKATFLEAERLFAEGISRVPNNADLHAYLGYAQLHLRKFAEAEREFGVALRLDQRNVVANLFLALKKKKGEWEKIGVAR
jgi:Flp pilus assembly protein TadD